MREINKIAEALFEKIRDRFEEVSLGDENAKATSKPEDARFFNFDYSQDGKNYGNITLSLIDEMSLKVYFSKNISQDLDDEERKKWYAFLRELREFAKRNLLNFEPRDITRHTLKHRDLQQVSKADSTYTKDEVVSEGLLHGTSRSSYQECGPARIIVRHVDRIDPERRGERSRHIKSIYLENSEGERFKLPYNNLRYARAMARHVSEGGAITDEFGQHITAIAEACSKLRPFKNSMRRRTFEDDETQTMVEAAFEYHGLLNNTLKRLGGRKGYHACKESWQADESLVDTDVDLESLRERFVKRVYNDQMDQALPLVQKAYKMKKENKLAQQFESWVDSVINEEVEPEYGDILELLADELPVGVDAINATGNLEGTILADNENYEELSTALLQLAEESSSADAREVIMSWMQQYLPRELEQITAEMTNDEPVTEDSWDDEEWDEDNVDAIQQAIVNRILANVNKHRDLLKKAGPDGVMNAARDVASFHAPMHEIGSSDVSIMVQEVYIEVGVPYPQDPIYEGKTKELAQDLEELTPRQFKAKYKQSKEEMRSKLTEDVAEDSNDTNDIAQELDSMLNQGADYVEAVKLIAKKYNTHPEYVVRAYEEWGNFEHDDTFDIKEQGVVEADNHVTTWAVRVVAHNNQFDTLSKTIKVKTNDFDSINGIVREKLGKKGYTVTHIGNPVATQDVAEDQGTDYVNRDEKLKRMGAKELGIMDKLKTIPQGMKAFAKGDTEDDLALYNKSKSTVDEEYDQDYDLEVYGDENDDSYEWQKHPHELPHDDEDELDEMRRLSGVA